jgi:hypothetical protein
MADDFHGKSPNRQMAALGAAAGHPTLSADQGRLAKLLLEIGRPIVI